MPQSSTRSSRSPTPSPPPARKSARLGAPTLVVIGRGRLGRSLAKAAGARLVEGHAWRARAPSLLKPGIRLVLAVPDPIVPALAAEIAGLSLPRGTAAIHLSGALGLDALLPIRKAGHAVGSFHPFQSFPTARPPTAFLGSLVAVDATTPSLLRELRSLARRLGARPRRVTDDERTRYHAAAVIGSNYLVALAGQATATLESIGWAKRDALAALLPLQRGVIESLASAGLPGALIGPIRRGDEATVARQLAALRQAGLATSAEVYRVLGLAALDLALEAGLEADAARRIEAALQQVP